MCFLLNDAVRHALSASGKAKAVKAEASCNNKYLWGPSLDKALMI